RRILSKAARLLDTHQAQPRTPPPRDASPLRVLQAATSWNIFPVWLRKELCTGATTRVVRPRLQPGGLSPCLRPPPERGRRRHHYL
ncbi:unnamed protein product, partial [Ectocarpus fasciculatus]